MVVEIKLYPNQKMFDQEFEAIPKPRGQAFILINMCGFEPPTKWRYHPQPSLFSMARAEALNVCDRTKPFYSRRVKSPDVIARIEVPQSFEEWHARPKGEVGKDE